jgi:type IV pilus assembly protein PilN
MITKDGEVNIRLRVSGDRDRAVQLVRNLETSQRFVAPRLSGEAAQTQEGNRAAGAVLVANTGAVEFDILSGYNPLPDVAKKGMNESGGKTGDHAAVASESSSGKHRLPTHKGSAEVQGGVAPPASRRTQTSPSHGGVR